MTKKSKIKYKKAPQAPRRFKSAYMFYSTNKHKEIREELGTKGVTEKTTNIAKLVSKAWKDLSVEERGKWEEMARKDKMRYEVEKSMYTGPWKVPAKKLSQKDPSAPKRPMSAFLAFSHSKRATVKAENATMNNAEISRVLAQMWKVAAEDEKKEFIDAEYELRQKYLSEIAVWREKTEKELSEQRRQREEIALQTVASRGAHGADPMAGEEQRHYPVPSNNSNANNGTAAADAEYYSSSQQPYYNGYPGARGGNPAMDAYYNGGPPPPNTVTPPSVAEYFEGGYADYGYGAGGPYGGGYYYPPPPHIPPPESGSAAAYSARGGGEYPYPPPPPHYGAGAYGEYPQQQQLPQAYRQDSQQPATSHGEDPYNRRGEYPQYESAAATEGVKVENANYAQA